MISRPWGESQPLSLALLTTGLLSVSMELPVLDVS